VGKTPTLLGLTTELNLILSLLVQNTLEIYNKPDFFCFPVLTALFGRMSENSNGGFTEANIGWSGVPRPIGAPKAN